MADSKLRDQDDVGTMSLTSLSPGLMRGGRHGAQSLSESGNYQGG